MRLAQHVGKQLDLPCGGRRLAPHADVVSDCLHHLRPLQYAADKPRELPLVGVHERLLKYAGRALAVGDDGQEDVPDVVADGGEHDGELSPVYAVDFVHHLRPRLPALPDTVQLLEQVEVHLLPPPRLLGERPRAPHGAGGRGADKAALVVQKRHETELPVGRDVEQCVRHCLAYLPLRVVRIWRELGDQLVVELHGEPLGQLRDLRAPFAPFRN